MLEVHWGAVMHGCTMAVLPGFKQVECLLLTPIKSDGDTSSSGKLWTGAADGTLLMWADESGSGQLDAAKGKLIKVEGGKCEWQLANEPCAGLFVNG